MDLQSASIAEITKDLIAFQEKCPVLTFDGKGEIKGYSKKTNKDYSYSYDYLTFKKLRDETKSILAESNLAIFQQTTFINDKFFIVTTVSHTSGEWIRGFYPIGFTPDDSQKVGSNITYAKRYAMAAILGIVADKDDDGEYENVARQLKRDAAEEKQRQIEKKVAEEKRLEAAEKVTAIEMAIENCSTQDELRECFTKTYARDLSWLRSNFKDYFESLNILKDDKKDKLNG